MLVITAIVALGCILFFGLLLGSGVAFGYLWACTEGGIEEAVDSGD